MSDENDRPATLSVQPFEWGTLETENMRRVGVVDVGSNSVRLVVFDGVARSPAYFYSEKVLCGLGEGIHETHLLSRPGRARAMGALSRFTMLARQMRIGPLTAVATAAVREAEDGGEFVAAVKAATGLDIQVISGTDEARLSAQGVLLGWPQANGVMCDMGGASMEFARLDEGVIGGCATAPIGPLHLANIAGGAAAVDAEIDRGLAALAKAVPGPMNKFFLVGGSWRALARLDMERCGYPLKVLHEYTPDLGDLAKTAQWLTTASDQDIRALAAIAPERMALLPLAARVLLRLLDRFGPERVTISSFGLREGMLYELMPESLRAKDPLLEAASHAEAANSRFPGFGDILFDWLRPLYAKADEEELRLVQAACRLHDISWRTHPDYRAQVCFEAVTRANLSGLDHEGRVFLGHALLYRYKSGGTGPELAPLALLTPERVRAAEVLGRAMRLGAMLTGVAAGGLENTALILERGEVVLRLKGAARALSGEVVERRLASLGERLGLPARVDLLP